MRLIIEQRTHPKADMLQKLEYPNRDKEGYKQMIDNIIHERATNLGMLFRQIAAV